MNKISRNEAPQTRVFPAITPDLYEIDHTPAECSLDQLTARYLLKLSENRAKGWRRRTANDEFARLAELMLWHRSAFEAELQGQFKRADYFWTKFHSGFRALFENTSVWPRVLTATSDKYAPEKTSDPAQIRSLFVNELLIDVHIALYNGYATSDSLMNRAFTHFNFINTLLGMSELNRDDTYNLLAPALTEFICLYSRARDWPEAVNACNQLIDCAPDPVPYEQILAELYAEYALSEQDDDSALQHGITCINDIIEDFPRCLRAYQAISRLYIAHAKKLENVRRYAEAVLAATKAVVFDPMSAEALELRGKLIEQLEGIKKTAEAELASKEDPSRHFVASRSLSYAVDALKAAEDYITSPSSTEVKAALILAKASHLWRNIGLASPTDQTGEQELRLLNALEQLNAIATTDEAELEIQWGHLANDDAILASLDSRAICSYVLRHGISTIPLEVPAPSAPSANPPCLIVKQAKRQWEAAPLDHWFFSRADVRIKAQAALALLLMLIFCVLGFREWTAQSKRDRAFQRLIQAADLQQQSGVVEAAEDFIAHLPDVGKDRRTRAVLDHYGRALVRLAVQEPATIGADLEKHVTRYKQITQNMGLEENYEKDN